MLISEKQHEANRQNAQHSCGPVTEEGKAAIRYNALTFGLRTRATVLQTENVADYYRLYNEFVAEWKPQTRTEFCHVETMVTSQWLLARIARSEQRVYMEVGFGERQFALLAQVDKRRAHLERSFRTAVADLKQAQKDRQARPQPQPAETSQTAKPAEPPAHNPAEHNPGPCPLPPDPGAYCAQGAQYASPDSR
jgi:hypothetical protein